jgi:hypothetical protein
MRECIAGWPDMHNNLRSILKIRPRRLIASAILLKLLLVYMKKLFHLTL